MGMSKFLHLFLHLKKLYLYVMSQHILVVDDDERVCSLLARYLQNEGYRVSTVNSGRTMLQLIERDLPALVALDLMLPEDNGLALAADLRSKYDIGIIMLTGKRDIVDRVVGLEMGADDYLAKPFDERELLARIRSVLRRFSRINSGAANTGRCARFAGWTLNFDANELTSATGEVVHLTNYEYIIMEAFVKSPNKVFSRDNVLNLTKGAEWVPADRSVDVLIGKLRKKLENGDTSRAWRLIKTVRGVGYKFTADVTYD